MKTVRQQATKCKRLRETLVAWIEAHAGHWRLGDDVADFVKIELAQRRMFTSGEVLKKELRSACRKGLIRRRIRAGTRYVEYTALEIDARGSEKRDGVGEIPPDPDAPPSQASGVLFDNSSTQLHGEDIGRRRR